MKRPKLLNTDVKIFFCKYNDPVYVKVEKLEVMVQVVQEGNGSIEAVLLELEQATHPCRTIPWLVPLAQKSVFAVSFVARIRSRARRAYTFSVD